MAEKRERGEEGKKEQREIALSFSFSPDFFEMRPQLHPHGRTWTAPRRAGVTVRIVGMGLSVDVAIVACVRRNEGERLVTGKEVKKEKQK